MKAKEHTSDRLKKRLRRKARIRAKVSGTEKRPRLCVFRGLATIYAQLIDDVNSKTLVAIHSKKVKPEDVGERKGKIAIAYTVGKTLAEQAKAKGIEDVVFDRGGSAYHGRVRALAEGAREAGLKF